MYKWQEETLQSLYARGPRLAHAILIQAAEGTGLFEFSMSWAEALLCESPPPSGLACGVCPACRWFASSNHPDFRLVQPESHALEPEPDEEAKPQTAREREKKSDQIKIDQIRELQTFLNVGTHRAGRRVVLVHPAEAMNTATQNALLKNLEEPGPQTIFLVASTQPHRLLPTVRSRCQVVDLPGPAPDAALHWLRGQNVGAAEYLLAMAGGAPLLALDMAARAEFLNQLADHLSNPRMNALAVAASCQRAAPVEVVSALYRWCYDLLSCRLAGRVRYHLAHGDELAALAANCPPKRIAAYLHQVSSARALAEHPLNPRLFMEDLLLGYAAMIDGGSAIRDSRLAR